MNTFFRLRALSTLCEEVVFPLSKTNVTQRQANLLFEKTYPGSSANSTSMEGAGILFAVFVSDENKTNYKTAVRSLRIVIFFSCVNPRSFDGGEGRPTESSYSPTGTYAAGKADGGGVQPQC